MTNIKIQLKEKLREQENVMAMWSQDVLKVSQKRGFDEYSKKGQRALNRVANKYAATLVELEDEIDELQKKLAEEE